MLYSHPISYMYMAFNLTEIKHVVQSPDLVHVHGLQPHWNQNMLYSRPISYMYIAFNLTEIKYVVQ